MSCGCRDLLLRRGADGIMAEGVGGATAGVNGFLTSENLGTSTWIGEKRQPKRHHNTSNAFESSTIAQVVGSPLEKYGKETSHLKQAQVKKKTHNTFHKDSK